MNEIDRLLDEIEMIREDLVRVSGLLATLNRRLDRALADLRARRAGQVPLPGLDDEADAAGGDVQYVPDPQ